MFMWAPGSGRSVIRTNIIALFCFHGAASGDDRSTPAGNHLGMLSYPHLPAGAAACGR
jgi:hypothetical protein